MHKRVGELSSPFSLYDLSTRLFQDVRKHLSNEVQREVFHRLLAGDLGSLAGYLEDLGVNADFLSHAPVSEVAAVRQLGALFEKNASMPGTDNSRRREAAFIKFHASEEACRKTNVWFSYASGGESFRSAELRSVFRQAKWIIYNLLGPLPDPHVLWEGCNFGPGMTFGSSSMEETNLYYKIGGNHTATPECLPLLSSTSFVRSWPLWVSTLVSENAHFQVVAGNRVTTVPKTAATDRTIAIEPSFNLFLQKGAEAYLTKQLRRYGVDLRRQGRNQHIARIGSMEPFHSATVDLSSASDTLAVELVRFLLPEPWFVLLDLIRSHSYSPDKGVTWVKYEKFSSMGNAFTFPLETIIFYALAKACTIETGGHETRLRVYGDDIIVDSIAYPLLVESLAVAGFKTNTEKTYVFGPFRETCGADFINGIDIRPVYLRKAPRKAWEVFTFHNRLLNNRYGLQLDKSLEYLHSLVKRPLYGPPDLGAKDNGDWYNGKSVVFDGYFHAPAHVAERFKRIHADWQCYSWRVLTYQRKPVLLDVPELNTTYQYLAFLKGMRKGEIHSVIHQPYQLKPTTFSVWPDRHWWPSYFYSPSLLGSV